MARKSTRPADVEDLDEAVTEMAEESEVTSEIEDAGELDAQVSLDAEESAEDAVDPGPPCPKAALRDACLPDPGVRTATVPVHGEEPLHLEAGLAEKVREILGDRSIAHDGLSIGASMDEQHLSFVTHPDGQHYRAPR